MYCSLCACLCMCECPTLVLVMKLHTNSLEYISQNHIHQILDISIWWRHGSHFALIVCGTLTVIIWSDFLQNWTRCSLRPPRICHRKTGGGGGGGFSILSMFSRKWQAVTHADRQRGGRKGGQTDRQKVIGYRQTDIHIDRHTFIYMWVKINSQIGRQTGLHW